MSSQAGNGAALRNVANGLEQIETGTRSMVNFYDKIEEFITAEADKFKGDDRMYDLMISNAKLRYHAQEMLLLLPKCSAIALERADNPGGQ